MVELGEGWDCVATLVGGRWVERRPKRPEIDAQLLLEAVVMPWLAPRLPLPVPVPVVQNTSPVVVRHELVPGRELTTYTAFQGRQLGEFLKALHAVPAEEARKLGVGRHQLPIDRFRAEVLPLVPEAEPLLDHVVAFPQDTLVHGDLGPEHVLGQDGVLTGVIDFGDMHLGDPAIDLAWALYMAPVEFADAVAAAYGVTEAERMRARIWYQLGPWHEVLYGNDIGDPATAANGAEGVRARLGGVPRPGH